jgi:hypothetical protein
MATGRSPSIKMSTANRAQLLLLTPHPFGIPRDWLLGSNFQRWFLLGGITHSYLHMNYFLRLLNFLELELNSETLHLNYIFFVFQI